MALQCPRCKSVYHFAKDGVCGRKGCELTELIPVKE
jgi:hypothetical protein